MISQVLLLPVTESVTQILTVVSLRENVLMAQTKPVATHVALVAVEAVALPHVIHLIIDEIVMYVAQTLTVVSLRESVLMVQTRPVAIAVAVEIVEVAVLVHVTLDL